MSHASGSDPVLGDDRRSDFANSEQSVPTQTAMTLIALAPRLVRLENAKLKSVSPPLTFRQFRILRKVSEGITSLSGIGQTATVALPTMSESVDGLVRRGLLTREQEPDDLRIARLQLTPMGASALSQAEAEIDQLGAELSEGLGESDLAETLRFLELVLGRVTERLARERR